MPDRIRRVGAVARGAPRRSRGRASRRRRGTRAGARGTARSEARSARSCRPWRRRSGRPRVPRSPSSSARSQRIEPCQALRRGSPIAFVGQVVGGAGAGVDRRQMPPLPARQQPRADGEVLVVRPLASMRASSARIARPRSTPSTGRRLRRACAGARARQARARTGRAPSAGSSRGTSSSAGRSGAGTRCRSTAVSSQPPSGRWVASRCSTPARTSGDTARSPASRPSSAHAVCDGVDAPRPASDSSSYDASVSPQPPSAFWCVLSHATARRTCGASRTSPMARKPASTDHVP